MKQNKSPFSPDRRRAARVNRQSVFSHGEFCSLCDFCYTLWRCLTISAKELLINDDIRVKEVRMLDENNGQLGIMSLNDAKTYAYDRGYDLVLIAPTATPPVARAMDYGKYRYEIDKREKEARKKQQVIEVKEVQLSCRIDTHDFETKANRAIKFLQNGDKVRVCLRFKGREIAHQEIGREVLDKFADFVSEYGAVDKKPALDGRQLMMFIVPLKANTAKKEAAAEKQTRNEPKENNENE